MRSRCIRLSLRLSRPDGNLDCFAAVHLVQRLLVLRDCENVRDLFESASVSDYLGLIVLFSEEAAYHALDSYFSAIQVLHRAREAIRLRK